MPIVRVLFITLLGLAIGICGHVIINHYVKIKGFSKSSLFVEAGSALLFVLAFFHEGFTPLPSTFLALAFWLLLVIAVLDARTERIPDILSVPFIAVSLAYALVTGVQPWVGMAICGGFLLLQWLLSRGRWVGGGDVLLACGVGALVRTPSLAILALFCAYIAGAIAAVILFLRGRKTLRGSVPFGPFPAIGGVIAVLWGEEILYRLLS